MSTQESEPHITSFNNDHLQVTVTRQPRCRIKFEIRVSPQAVEAAYQKAVKIINKDVNIPGFRKGRAPQQLIIEKFSSVIHKEFVDIVLQTSINEAMYLTHIHSLKDVPIRPIVHECNREKGAHFVVEFEGRPTVPSIQIEEIVFNKATPKSVTDEDRQNLLHNILFQMTTYEPIEDRSVQKDDFIDIDVTLLGDLPRQVIQNQRTHVNEIGLPPWLYEKVLGLKAGESVEGMTQQTSTLLETDSDFQSLPFRATIKAIWKGTQPAIDDQFAQRLGLKDVEDLHNKIEERLNTSIQEETFKQNVHTLEQLLIEKYPVDLPQSYIDHNIQIQLDRHLESLDEQNIDYDEVDIERVRQTIEHNVIRQLTLFFLLHKFAIDKNISTTETEIAQELVHQVQLFSRGRDSIDLQKDKQEVREQIKNLIVERKAQELLIAQATPTQGVFEK